VIIPHDLDAERSIVGGCLPFPDAIPDLVATLEPADFYDQTLAKLWTVIGDLYRSGSAVDHLTIRDAYCRHGWDIDAVNLAELMANSLRPRTEHVDIVLRHSHGRRLMMLARSVCDEAGNGANPYGLAEQLRTDIASLDTPTIASQAKARTLEDIILKADDLAPFVIPGLMRSDWRAIVVGAEGVGKSVLLRQIAVLSAQGVHPFDFKRFDPIRVLIVDLENPAAAIKETGSRMVDQLHRTVGDRYDPNRLRIHMRPGGIDIRGRHDRTELEREIIAHRPDLLAIGPVYKLSHRRDRESYEDATDPVLRILDDLRTRHGFALLMEHHPPQGYAGGRDIRPFGSQRWLAWPELGIGLRPNDAKTGQRLTRWRGDRLHNRWPDEIHQGQVWPFVGHWNHPERTEAF
jgi:hypothetical protein